MLEEARQNTEAARAAKPPSPNPECTRAAAVVRLARDLRGGEPGGPEPGGGRRRRLHHPRLEDGLLAAGLRRLPRLAEAQLKGMAI